MPKYAFLNSENVCVGDAVYSQTLNPIPESVVEIGDEDSCIGKMYLDGIWVEPQKVYLPEVVITKVSVDDPYADVSVISKDFSTIKLPVGASVNIGVEIRVGKALVENFNDSFAMPMRSTDGVLRHINVNFVNGKASFVASMNDSRRWEVTEALINSNLEPENYLKFSGIVITAVE